MPRLYWLGLFLAVLEAPLPAQVPGGYPGQYPGYPGTGGVGLPIPRRQKKDKNAKVELQSTDGMLRRIEKDQVIVEADDHRIVNFKRNDNTKFIKEGTPIKAAELRAGDLVEVESSQDDEGFMTAVNVIWQQDASAKDRDRAAEPVDVSLAKSSKDKGGDEDRPMQHRADTPAATDSGHAKPATAADSPETRPAAVDKASDDEPSVADLNKPTNVEVPAVRIDADDEGPPVLKHGGRAVERKPTEPLPAAAPRAPQLSAANRAPEPAEESTPEAREVRAAPAVQRPEEVKLEQARDAAGSFLESLPSYVCKELMTRYQSETHTPNWRPLDVVSMALVYEDGRESYRDLAINGKPVKKNIEDLQGSWSTGEFGTVLADVFSPATAADFEYRRESRIGGRTALLYDFKVEREHSHWRIMVASQLVTPSYKGSVWIDKETSRVLRIEMQTTHMPEAFPSDKVESATDYEFVRIGERQFLLPVHAETLSCQRDSDLCSRNTIDFRNYHKYSGESTITFDK